MLEIYLTKRVFAKLEFQPEVKKKGTFTAGKVEDGRKEYK